MSKMSILKRNPSQKNNNKRRYFIERIGEEEKRHSDISVVSLTQKNPQILTKNFPKFSQNFSQKISKATQKKSQKFPQTIHLVSKKLYVCGFKFYSNFIK